MNGVTAPAVPQPGTGSSMAVERLSHLLKHCARARPREHAGHSLIRRAPSHLLGDTMVDSFPPGSILLPAAILAAEDGLPCPRQISLLEIPTLLDLMDFYLAEVDHSSAPGRAAAEGVLLIGTGLAHRMGIHCDAYIGLMCEHATARDWRFLYDHMTLAASHRTMVAEAILGRGPLFNASHYPADSTARAIELMEEATAGRVTGYPSGLDPARFLLTGAGGADEPEMFLAIPILDEPDTLPHYVREFPAFEGIDPPDLPPDFEDWSWCHDEAPSWGSDARLCKLLMFHPDEARRGPSITYRYYLAAISARDDELMETLALTNEWADVLAALPPLPASRTESQGSVGIERTLLARIEANLAWLIAAAPPHLSSEPESYGLADAAAAQAELAAILARDAADPRLTER
jgi:hypothetical protein